MSASILYAPGLLGLLAPLQEFLADRDVTEIMINRPQELFVEKGGQIIRKEALELTQSYLKRLFILIANENNQVLNESNPLLSGNLPDGSRVQLVMPPAAKNLTCSIRKFSAQGFNFSDYQTQDFFARGRAEKNQDEKLLYLYKQEQFQTFLVSAIKQKKTIVISGATSSGKTTFLNACLQKIEDKERLIILEDTFEIKPKQLNTVHLKAVKALNNVSPVVSLQDLVQASLRLRPDRLIMGEIRGREIFDFVSACLTGHNGSMATIHADSPQNAFKRMAQLYQLNPTSLPYQAILELLHDAIDIVVQLHKTANGRKLTDVYFKEAV